MTSLTDKMSELERIAINGREALPDELVVNLSQAEEILGRLAKAEAAVVGENLYKQVAKKLWGLLDSIDTLPDMLHPNTFEAHKKTWLMMVKKAEERHELLKTDGYNLALPTSPDRAEASVVGDWEDGFRLKRHKDYSSVISFDEIINGEIAFIKKLLAAKDREIAEANKKGFIDGALSK